MSWRRKLLAVFLAFTKRFLALAIDDGRLGSDICVSHPSQRTRRMGADTAGRTDVFTRGSRMGPPIDG
jgi:hypothetical protein